MGRPLASAVGPKQEWGNLACETQNLRSPFDPGGEYGADCRDCSRVSCCGCCAIGTLYHDRSRRHGRGMDPLIFLLPCYCSLVHGTNSWHPLRFIHGRGNGKSRRLARRSLVVVRTSSFFWSADGEGLDAEGQPDGQSDYVVSGSDVFRRCSNPKRAMGMALGRPVEQAVLCFCAVLGGRNVGQQLEESHRRLRQGPAHPQSMRSAGTKCFAKTGLYTPGNAKVRIR